MICDSCVHKDVCYVGEEDREALKHCSDYLNFDEEIEKVKIEFKNYVSWCIDHYYITLR